MDATKNLENMTERIPKLNPEQIKILENSLSKISKECVNNFPNYTTMSGIYDQLEKLGDDSGYVFYITPEFELSSISIGEPPKTVTIGEDSKISITPGAIEALKILHGFTTDLEIAKELESLIENYDEPV